MQNESYSKNNSLSPVMIGFILILLVIILFFAKSYFKSKGNEEIAKLKQEEKISREEKYASVSQEDLLEKITAKKGVIVDMRPMEEFQREHILDSINITLGDLEKALPFLEKNKEYFLVDSLGLTPNQSQALEILEQSGFAKVSFLEGGFSGWKNDSYPTVSFGDPYSLSDQSKVIYISSDELRQIEQKEKNLFILDVREKSEFSKERINGASNIFLDDLEKERDKIPSSKKIILYDNDGLLAFQAAVRLFDFGIFNVYALSDGLKTWKEKGFETVRQ
jgi:rhodanese-related sulfurtransferase